MSIDCKFYCASLRPSLSFAASYPISLSLSLSLSPSLSLSLSLSLSPAATFVNLLLEVESTYEVHDYIKSFLGETDDVHAFAKQFLERRQKIRNYGQPVCIIIIILTACL